MAQKDIVVNLRLQKDESSSLVIKNLSDQIKSVGKAFNTIERDVDKTSTRITELNTTLKDAKKSIADLVGKSGSTSGHLKEFNKQMMSLRTLAKMMGDALKTSRISVENLGTSTVTAATKVSTSEANMTAAVAKGTATRNALRAKESSGWTTQTIKPIGSYVKPSSSQLSSARDNAIISMREELKKTVPIWDIVAENTKKATAANANWVKGVNLASTSYAEWTKTTGAATTAHKGFWGSLKNTANGLASVNTHTEGAMAKTAFLVTKVLKLMAAYMAFRFALQMVSQEMKAAFTVTEDYTRSVVEMAALMTTFAVPKPGEDPSETYQRSYEYAKKLVIELEKLDMQTIANAQDLKTMAQAFIMNGVQINVQNKQAMEGFRNLANALKILVGNFPNQQAQISQEIRAMLLGTAKASDTLSKVMKAKLGSGWADIMKKWRAEGPDEFIIKIGQALKGFELATKDIEGLWETLTSSLKTIHDIIFRMAFKGLHEDIIGGLQGVVTALRDVEGNLTPLARNIGKALVESWLFFKTILKDVYFFIMPILWAIKMIVKFLWEIKALSPIILGLFSMWLLKVMGIAAILRVMTGTSAIAFAAMTTALATATTATGRFLAMLTILRASWPILAIGAITTAILLMKNALDKTSVSVKELIQQYKFLTLAELKDERRKAINKVEDLGGTVSIKAQDWMSDIPSTIDEIKTKWQELNKQEINVGKAGEAAFIEKHKAEQTYLELLLIESKTKKDIADLDNKILAEKDVAKTKSYKDTKEALAKDLQNSKAIREKLSIKTTVDFPKGGKADVKYPTILGLAVAYLQKTKDQTKAANELLAVDQVTLETLKDMAMVPAPELMKQPAEDDKTALKSAKREIEQTIEKYDKLYQIARQKGADLQDENKRFMEEDLITRELGEKKSVEIAEVQAVKEKEAMENLLIALEPLYDKYKKLNKKEDYGTADREKANDILAAKNKIDQAERESSKIKRDASTKLYQEEKANILALSQLTLKSKETEIASILELKKIDMDRRKTKLEELKGIDEISASDYYKEQIALVEELRDKEIEASNAKQAAWLKDWKVREKAQFVVGTKIKIDPEKYKTLELEKTEYLKEGEAQRTSITQSAINKRLELEFQAARELETIYSTKGDAGVMLRALDDLDKEWKKKWDDIYKFTQDIFKGIADSGSNLMFDVLTGKLDTFGNYFKNVWNTILKHITDETSKTFVKMFEDMIKPQLEKLVGSTSSSFMDIPTTLTAPAMKGYYGSQTAPKLEGVSELTSTLGDSVKTTEKNTKGLDKASQAMALVAVAITLFQMASQAINNPNSVRAGDFAAKGAGIGAIIGTLILPGIGTLIGAGIGAIQGFIIGGLIDLFNSVEKIAMKFKFDVSNLSVDVSEGTFGLSDKMAKALGRTFLAFRESLISLATNMGTNVENFYRDWEGTQNSGDANKALGRIMRKYMMFTLNIDPKDFKRQGEDLQETIDRIVGALKGLARLQVTLGITIDMIGKVDDAVLDWHIKMVGLKDDIKEYTTAFDNMFDQPVDPSDMNAMAQNLYNALVEKYNMEKQMVQDLVDKVKTARENFASFISDLSKKIYDLGPGENIGRYTSGTGLENSPEYLTYLKKTMDDLKQTATDMANATDTFTPEQIVTGFEDMKKAVDDWYEAMTTAITDYYERQIAVIQEGIDLLNEEKDANDKKLDILNKQVDAIKDWKSLLDDVNSMIWDMKTSISSPRDSRERLAYALGGVLEARGKFLGSGTEEEKLAAGKTYQEKLSDYLKIAQEAYTRPSSEYQSIYNQIITWLGEIAGYAEANSKDPTELLKEIAGLEARNEIIQTSIDAKNVEIAGLNKLMQEDLAALKVDAQGYYKWVKEHGAEAYGTYIGSLEQQLKDIIGEGTVQSYFIDLREALKLSLLDISTKLETYYDVLTGGGAPTANTPTNIVPTPLPNTPIHGLPLLGLGALVRKPTLSVIGEKGPEYVIPQKDMLEMANRVKSFNSEEGNIVFSPNFVINTTGEVDEKHLADVIQDRMLISLRRGKGKQIVRKLF